MQRTHLNQHCSDISKFYFSCECTFGCTGQNCSEEINECDSDLCLALCQESTIPGQFVCLCPPFYTGKFCHQHYNPCDPLTDPCRNNSTCLTLVDGNHYCVCREGKNLFLFCFVLCFCFFFSMDDGFLRMGERTPIHHWGMWEYLTPNAGI